MCLLYPILTFPFFGSRVRCRHHQCLPLLLTPANPVLGKTLNVHTVTTIVSLATLFQVPVASLTPVSVSSLTTCPVFSPRPSTYSIARGFNQILRKPSCRSMDFMVSMFNRSRSLPTLLFLWSPCRCDKSCDLRCINLREKGLGLGI